MSGLTSTNRIPETNCGKTKRNDDRLNEIS